MNFTPPIKVFIAETLPKWRELLLDFFLTPRYELVSKQALANLAVVEQNSENENQFLILIGAYEPDLPIDSGLFWIENDVDEKKFRFLLKQALSTFDTWYELQDIREQLVVPKPYLEIFSQRIQNQLKGMSGLANVLREPYLSDLQRQKYADYISGNANRMQNFFANLWEYYQFKHNRKKAKVQTFLLHDFLKEMHERFQRILISQEKSHIDFDLDEAESVSSHELTTDKRRLIIILSNILDNAVQYTHKGSIKWFAKLSDSHLLIGVENNMAESMQKQHKLNLPSNLGLGLLVAHYNAEIIGAELSVEQNEHSTRACLRMPFA